MKKMIRDTKRVEEKIIYKQGLFLLYRDGIFNIVGKNGKPIFKEWFDWVGDVVKGYSKVKISGEYKYNYIKAGEIIEKLREGNVEELVGEELYVFDEWFAWYSPSKNGYDVVMFGGKFNIVEVDGEGCKYICKEWYETMTYFSKYGICRVGKGDKYNIINREGEVIGKEWYDLIDRIEEEILIVKMGDKWNCIDIKGEILYDMWFDKIECFIGGVVNVKLNNEWYILDNRGNLEYSTRR